MQPGESKLFVDAVTGTFEAFSARPPSQVGMEAWFRTLREFPLGHVVDALDGWVKRSNRAPTAAQIAEVCYERGIREREEQSERWKREEEQAPISMAQTEAGRRALRMMRDALNRPKADPLEWAHKIVERYLKRDDSLAHASFVTACEALGKTREDREELKALRAMRRAA